MSANRNALLRQGAKSPESHMQTQSNAFQRDFGAQGGQNTRTYSGDKRRVATAPPY